MFTMYVRLFIILQGTVGRCSMIQALRQFLLYLVRILFFCYNKSSFVIAVKLYNLLVKNLVPY